MKMPNMPAFRTEWDQVPLSKVTSFFASREQSKSSLTADYDLPSAQARATRLVTMVPPTGLSARMAQPSSSSIKIFWRRIHGDIYASAKSTAASA